MLCNRCGQTRSRYSVGRPGGGTVKLCSPCFTHGLNKGTIVVIGKKAVAA